MPGLFVTPMTRDYQITTWASPSRTIASPALHWNAAANAGRFEGAPTAATRFGGPAERVFLEVGPETRPCSHPLIPDKQCLQVREVRFDENGLRVGEPGEWQNFFDEIEGYTHQPGVRNVLRIDRYTRANVPADASRYAYVLDMVVESEQVTR